MEKYRDFYPTWKEKEGSTNGTAIDLYFKKAFDRVPHGSPETKREKCGWVI